MKHRLEILLTLACVALTACADADGGDTKLGGLTAGEAAQLDEAAERIDALPPGPGEGPARSLEDDTAAQLANERARLPR